MEIVYYGGNDYRDYLAHHGVKGMHWGIRRYQPYSVAPRASGKGGKEIGQAKTGIIRRAQIRLGYNRQNTINRYINTARAKGVINKASAFAGHHRGQKSAENRQHMHERLAQASKTRLGKNMHQTMAANYNYLSQYHKFRRTMPIGERATSRLIYNGTLAKMPVQRLSGRTSTYGKELLNYALTGGLAGHVLDAKYKRAKSGKTEARIQKKIDKIEGRDARRQEKIMTAREKTRAKMVSGKKNLLSPNVKDFDAGTRQLQKGMAETSRKRTAALKMKKAAVKDPTIKKTAAYKQARKDRWTQTLKDGYYGKLGADVMETSRMIRSEERKKKKAE